MIVDAWPGRAYPAWVIKACHMVPMDQPVIRHVRHKRVSPEKTRMRCASSLPLSYRRLLARAAAARRARRAAAPGGASDDARFLFEADALAALANLSLRARLANRFTDAMLAIDEALSMCEIEREESRDASWIEPQIRATYDQVNALMKVVCD